MAKIVLAMAVPHSGMLGKSPDSWAEDGERDRKKDVLWYRNKQWTYPELEHERRNEGFAKLITLEERRARGARCTAALEVMRRIYQENKPDVAIVLGKDQKEIFVDHSPSLAVYSGAEIYNGPPQRSVYAPDRDVTHPACPELAMHLIDSLQASDFDLTDLFQWPPNTWMKPPKPIVPHAYGFIYHRIMADQPPPTVPVILNCFYPPTQPSFKRSLMFGKALYNAIQSWDSDKTVAIIASGGLTHFVCDEQLDAVFLKAFETNDFERLAQVDERSYQSGTSEVKLYVSILWAVSQLGWKMNVADYVPCYRTEAGTGEGFAFMSWTPPQAGE
jgi:hypothetical protein